MFRNPACTVLLVAIASATGLATTDAVAWGPDGHRIVAEVAQRRMSERARTEALRLLALDGETSLADISNWADAIRDQPSHAALAGLTRPMHYMRFADASCRFEPATTCVDGACIIGGIERYTAVLADRSRSDVDRAEALRFVVHFIGDIHQPLHAGYRRDRGGFSHAVKIGERETSMHGVWDYDIVGSRGLDWRDYATELVARAAGQGAVAGTPAEWAQESCRVTRDGDIYPPTERIDPDYVTRMRPIVERRMLEAAQRLTRVLDAALAPRARSG